MRDEDLPGNADRMGAILMEGLREIQADYPVIGDVRGLGLMVATEFVHPDGSPNPEAVKQVVAKAFEDKTLLDHLRHLRSGDPDRAAAGGERGADSGVSGRLSAGGGGGGVMVCV